jgi:hypothetical protein
MNVGDYLRSLFPPAQLEALDRVRQELLTNPKALDNTNRPEDECTTSAG